MTTFCPKDGKAETESLPCRRTVRSKLSVVNGKASNKIAKGYDRIKSRAIGAAAGKSVCKKGKTKSKRTVRYDLRKCSCCCIKSHAPQAIFIAPCKNFDVQMCDGPTVCKTSGEFSTHAPLGVPRRGRM